MTRSGSGEPEVHRITAARRAHSDDQGRRMSRYLISMLIRTVCVVLVFVVHGPARWVFVVGAVFLPYVAVVFANAGGDRRPAPPTSQVPPRVPPALGPGGTGSPGDQPNG